MRGVTIKPKEQLMTTTELEMRLTAVELELARLKTQIALAPPRQNNWIEDIAGTFANDPVFDEAMALGRKWRESQRPKPPRAKTSVSKSLRRKALK